MAYRYGHLATAISGIMKYVQLNYPDSYVTVDIQKNKRLFELGNLLSEYRQSRGSNPSKDIDKNAKYIQNDFQSFVEYCKQKLKTNG